MTDEAPKPEVVPVIDAVPAEAPKVSKWEKVKEMGKKVVQGLLRKISEYPGTAFIVAVGTHAARSFL